jgi:hypothetical protein
VVRGDVSGKPVNRRGEAWDREDLVNVLNERGIYIPPDLNEISSEPRSRQRMAKDARLADVVF